MPITTNTLKGIYIPTRLPHTFWANNAHPKANLYDLILAASTGIGDMTKAVYDTDSDGIVDAAESVPWSGVTSTPSAFPVDVAKNDSLVGTRSRINLIEGSNITLTVVDDSGNGEVDVTIAAAGGTPSVISPSTLTSTTNDWSPTGIDGADIVRISGDNTFVILTGIAAPSGGYQQTVLSNVGSYPILLAQLDTGSSAGNRFNFDTDVVLQAGDAIHIYYDNTSSVWRNISTTTSKRNSAHNGLRILEETLVSFVSTAGGDYKWWNFSAGGGSISQVGGTAGEYQRAIISSNVSATGLPVIYGNGGSAYTHSTSAGTASFVRYIGRLETGTTLSDGTDTYILRFGLSSGATSAGDQSHGAYFRYTHSENSGNWTCVTRNSGTESSSDSGVAVATATVYGLEVVIRPDGYAVFRINGTEVGRINTNVPTGSVTIINKLQKTAGTSARSADVMACGVFAVTQH